MARRTDARGGMQAETLAGPEAPRVQATGRLTVDTDGEGFVDLTGAVAAWVADLAVADGLLHLFVRHTSASLTIQENADPDVLADLATALRRLAPEDAPWRHASEGPDDMPAHVRAMLTATSLAVPVVSGRLALGTWQAIYLAEHRRRPHRREVLLVYSGR